MKTLLVSYFFILLPFFIIAQSTEEINHDEFQKTESVELSVKYSYNLIKFALDNKTYIGLTEENIKALNSAIDAMFVKEDLYSERYPEQIFNSDSLQNQIINSLFTDVQYCNFTILRYTKKARARAQRDWDEMKLRGLNSKYDEAKTVNDFFKFYICKYFAYGRYASNEKIRKRYLENLYNSESGAIARLYIARKYNKIQLKKLRPTEYSQFSAVIRYSDKLGVNITQIQLLLDKVQEFNHLKDSLFDKDLPASFDFNAYQCSNLKAILTEKQYNDFLVLKNSDKAKKMATGSWGELKKRNLISEDNTDAYIAEFLDFYLKQLCLVDKNEDNKVYQTKSLTALMEFKPKALYLLERKQKKSDSFDKVSLNN